MQCERCNYDLAGLIPANNALVCPECSHHNPAQSPTQQPRIKYFDWLTLGLGLGPVLVVIGAVVIDPYAAGVFILLFGLPIASIIGAMLGAIERAASGIEPHRSYISRVFLFFVPLLALNILFSAVLGGTVFVYLFRNQSGC